MWLPRKENRSSLPGVDVLTVSTRCSLGGVSQGAGGSGLPVNLPVNLPVR